MKAYRLDAHGRMLVDVPEPTPLPGQVLVRVTAAGLCHSDLALSSRPPETHPFELPIVLGHELAGTVVQADPGARVQVGDAVVGYGPRGCGRCARCLSGAPNYCPVRPRSTFPPGLGADGALAEYIAVDPADLIVVDGLDPTQAAALTDAGLTAFHALRRALSVTAEASTATVVVLGVGGLGHLAVQFARLAGCTVVAIDRAAEKLALAESLGADLVLASNDGTSAAVRELTHGNGADVVLDLVANQVTLDLAASMVSVGGRLSVVGVGSGRLPVGMHALPLGVTTDLPHWGTRADLRRVLDLARDGRVRAEVAAVGFDGIDEAYARLAAGEILGRAVLDPTA